MSNSRNLATERFHPSCKVGIGSVSQPTSCVVFLRLAVTGGLLCGFAVAFRSLESTVFLQSLS